MSEAKTANKWWKSSEFSKKREFLDKRSKLNALIRNFFDSRGFLEVETPVLQVCPGMEVHIKVLETEIEGAFGGKETLYLHTSPEFSMKKLLAAGMDKIYQMTPVFRNSEFSPRHHVEFRMLEWYRAHSDYRDLMDDCEALLNACAPLCSNGLMHHAGMTVDPKAKVKRTSIAELFSEYADIDLSWVMGDEPSFEPEPKKFKDEALRIGIKTTDEDRFEDVFFRIYLEKIESNIGKNEAEIVYDYPLCMAALSRPKPEDKRFAERFELYACGLELANAFSELVDVKEQRERFNHDFLMKQKLYGKACAPDDEFLEALADMPASSGIALGVDRLAMLVASVDDIKDVLWVPLHEPRSAE